MEEQSEEVEKREFDLSRVDEQKLIKDIQEINKKLV